MNIIQFPIQHISDTDDDSFDKRIEKIKQSIKKINELMDELRKIQGRTHDDSRR